MVGQYTDAYRVADYLGSALTAAQEAQVASLIPAAGEWIESYTGRSYGLSDPVVGETHALLWNARGGVVYLRNRPVASVQAVRARYPLVGATATTLTAGQHYELLDPDHGTLLLDASCPGDRIEVDYTPNVPVGPKVQLAATILVAHWLRRGTDAGQAVSPTGATGAVKSYAIGSELNVTYDTSTATASSAVDAAEVPPDVKQLLVRKLVMA